MNAREGFRRIARFYVLGWWGTAFLVPVAVFAYVYLTGPTPLNVDPGLWFWLRPCLLSAISIVLLMIASWIVAGFFSPSDGAPPQRERKS